MSCAGSSSFPERSGDPERCALYGRERPDDKKLYFYLTPLRDIIKVMERQYDVHFVVRDSTLLNNRFTLSTSKVNVDHVLRDLEAVSSITLPMASISFPSVMNLVWGLGWSGLPIVLPYSILVRRKREKTDIPILIGSVSPINNKRRG